MNYDLELLDLYKTILTDFKNHQSGLQELGMAGGALRDMLLDKPIKDIDIFYKGTLDEEGVYKVFHKPPILSKVKATFKAILHDDDEDILIAETYPESTFKVPYQELYYKDVKFPIQLIEVKDSDLILNWIKKDFGCNISKVLLGHGGELLLTQEFIQDATLQILTFKSDCQQSYASKLIAKYPEYSCNGLGGYNTQQW